MNHIFISHVEEDYDIAMAIAQGLEADGYATWYYERDSVPGVSWISQIIRAIQVSQVVVLVITPNSINSNLMNIEIEKALESKKPLLPVLYNISHKEFQKRKEDWATIIGTTTSISIPLEGVSIVLPRIVEGLKLLGVKEKRMEEIEQVPMKELKGNLIGGGKTRQYIKKIIIAPRIIQIPVWIFLIILLSAVCYISIWPLLRNSIERNLSSTSKEYIRVRDSLLGAMPWLNWIVYDPTNYNPYDNVFPSKASIRQDLIVLRSHSFNGLITMSSNGKLQPIAQIAHEEGFNKVIVGVWDLRNEEEILNALQSAPYADAFCLGDRGLTKRYSFSELENLMERFRKETQRPVTTTEVIAEYETNTKLIEIGDFLFPDVHTFWQKGQSPAETWDETVILARRAAQLVADIPEKQVLLKMVSYPSGGADFFSQETQLEFYRLAVEGAQDQTTIPARVSFSFLCAFDPIWKSEDWGWAQPEQHVGLFTHDRNPKLAVTEIKWEIHK